MDTDIDPEFQMNATTIDIYVEPAEGRHRVYGFNMSEVNLTWEVIEYEEDELRLQLFFNAPVTISPLEDQDWLVFHAKEHQEALFYSTEL